MHGMYASPSRTPDSKQSGIQAARGGAGGGRNQVQEHYLRKVWGFGFAGLRVQEHYLRGIEHELSRLL